MNAHWIKFCAVFALLLVLESGSYLSSVRGQETAASEAGKADEPESGTAAGGLEAEYAKLAQMLNSTDVFGQRDAAEKLLRVRPSDVQNADTKKLIARGYRSLALDGRGPAQEEAIQGLAIWAGKFSVPVFVEILEKDSGFAQEEVFSALAKLKDPRGAVAVARFLGDHRNHDEAAAALRRMGPVAEDAVGKAAASSDPEVSLAAVQMLGEIGTEKSLPLLQKAMSSRNRQVKEIARQAIKQIRERQQSGTEAGGDEQEDPDSPFAEGAGPPVDITASDRIADNDARPRGASRRAGMRGSSGMSPEELEKLDKGDWSEVQMLLPGAPQGKGVTADAAPSSDKEWKPQPVRLANAADVSERVIGFGLSTGPAPVGVLLHDSGFNRGMTRMELVDLARRKSLGSSAIANVGIFAQTVVAISPGGTRVAVASTTGTSDRVPRVNIWKIEGGSTVQTLTWWPFESTGAFNRNDISWAHWADESRLFTMNEQGRLVLWNTSGKVAKAIYQLDCEGRSIPALSSGKKYLGLTTPRGAEIFAVSDGSLLARMDQVRPGAGAMAFSADGTRLVCVSWPSLYVWDTTNGKLVRDFDCTELRQIGFDRGESVTFLDNDHLLVGGSDVVDLERRLIAWRYTAPGGATVARGNWLLATVHQPPAIGIMPAEILNDTIKASTEELDADKVLALKPGAKVSLDIQLGGEDQAKAEAALSAALKRSGMTIEPNQSIVLTARLATGESVTQKYASGGFRDQNVEEVTTSEQRYEVELTYNGESAWKHITVLARAGGPSTIWLKGSESAQEAVDREKTEFKERMSYAVSLPRYVVLPKYSKPFGESTITLRGVEKAQRE